MRYAALLFSLFLLAAPATAQDAVWRDLVGQAVERGNAGDWEGAAERAEQAIAAATAPDETYNALRLLAEIRVQQEDWAEVVSLSEAAIAVVEAHAPEAQDAVAYMLRLSATAQARLGDEPAWRAAVRRFARSAITASRRVWAGPEDAPRHRMSGYRCPASLGAAQLVEALAFDAAAGLHAGCVYGFPGAPNAEGAIYLKLYEHFDGERLHAGARYEVIETLPGAREISRRDAADFEMRETVYEAGTGRLTLRTAHAGDWALTVRAGGGPDLTPAMQAAFADAAIAGLSAVGAHRAQCGALDGVDAPSPLAGAALEAAVAAAAAAMRTLAFEAGFPLEAGATDAPECPLGAFVMRSAPMRAAARLEPDGPHFAAWASASPGARPVFLARPAPAGEGTYLALRAFEGDLDLIAVWTGAPSGAGFLAWARETARGAPGGLAQGSPAMDGAYEVTVGVE